MLSKQHRFHGLNSLRFVYGRGQTVRTQHTALKYAHNKRRKGYRVAVVVSKKVSKSAVTRNRIRRRLYELVRKNQQLIKGPYDLVFLVYSDTVADANVPEIENQVVGLLNKLPKT